jgi:hypothetical protein
MGRGEVVVAVGLEVVRGVGEVGEVGAFMARILRGARSGIKALRQGA